MRSTLSIRSASTGLAIVVLGLACGEGPLPADESDTTAAESDTTESDTAESDDTDTGTVEPCSPPHPGSELSWWSVKIDGVDVLIDGDRDLTLSCTVMDDADDTTLVLDCGESTFELTHAGEWSPTLVDVEGASVQLRFVYDKNSAYGDQWVRLDFVGEDLSVFLVEAQQLEPPSAEWINPWGLAVGQECLLGGGDVAQSLTLEREGQVLDLWPLEFGQIPEQVDFWVEDAFRTDPVDESLGWKDVVIISRGHLAAGEVCDPGMDACGPGLACCYPCGDGGCDYACEAEDPETMQCPPPPP